MQTDAEVMGVGGGWGVDDQAQHGTSGARLPESTLLSGRDVKVLHKLGVGLGVSFRQVKITVI